MQLIYIGYLLNTRNDNFEQYQESVISNKNGKETNQNNVFLLMEKLNQHDTFFERINTQIENQSAQQKQVVNNVVKSFNDQLDLMKKDNYSMNKLIQSIQNELTITKSLNNDNGNGNAKIDYEMIGSIINSHIKELPLNVNEEMIVNLVKKHTLQKQQLIEAKKIIIEDRVNLVLRSLGTRIYKLGTCKSLKKNPGWRGFFFETGSSPTIVQSANIYHISKGDCWCVPDGNKAQITFAFNQLISPSAINIIHFQNSLNIRLYGRRTAFGREKLVHAFTQLPANSTNFDEHGIDGEEVYKYLRIEFQKDSDNGKDPICIYRVQIF